MQYAELSCKTHYSFLEGASHPSELVESAHALGLSALAITDRNGVYGAPKAHRAALEFPKLKLLIGAELTLEKKPLTLIARNRAGYGALCRILTESHRDKEKGEANLELGFNWAGVKGMENLYAISKPKDRSFSDWIKLQSIFGSKLSISLSRFFDGEDSARFDLAKSISEKLQIPIVATNEVHTHQKDRQRLQDVLTAIRLQTPLSKIGTGIFKNGERTLKSPKEMHALFQGMPEAITRGLEIADDCRFSLSELKYTYPSEWIPSGQTAQSYLEKLAWEGAKRRFPDGVALGFQNQIAHELKLIRELGYADYFLTIWEIVSFARSRGILCQGRGSAANSVICYCLEITAVDPIRMNLLFERFISVERGEPPDIDVDFEASRREEVIQHVYEKYGRDRAGMVAAIITYQKRMATREVAKVLEVDLEAVHDVLKDTSRATEEESAERDRKIAALDDPKLKLALELSDEISGFPRHLSIHSGGFTLSADPIIETVPIEPARMENRTIIQWDKVDLEAVGLLKVDLLSLGMLTAIQKTLEFISTPEKPVKLHDLPAEDPKTYEMIRRADTVGVFQIESRAQMGMLPRLKPRTYYDLVIQVAIVRPGPIVGKMVHPYLKRRRGEEAIDIPHPALEPILRKTLGVPLFQEQVMKMAVALAGFTPGESDELRRAIGAWRSSGKIQKVGKKLRDGLLKSGLSTEFVDRIFLQIQGFSEYGFPESHAASFALLAYASSYLKCHHPTEFTCALINSQPMGFYANHTLIDDAKRHGVKVLPIDPNLSAWDCSLENRAFRLGFRVVKGIHEKQVKALIAERERAPFKDLSDFFFRSKLGATSLQTLALGGAFESFQAKPREALWKLLELEAYRMSDLSRAETPQLEFFDSLSKRESKNAEFSPDPTTAFEDIQNDYRSLGLSLRGHPMEAVKEAIRKRGKSLPKLNSAQIKKQPDQKEVQVSGLFIVRQRPPTAHGTSFATLEDEAGLLDLILKPDVYERFRDLYWHVPFLIVSGKLQKDGHAISLIVRRLAPVFPEIEIQSEIQSRKHPRDYRIDAKKMAPS